MVKNCVMELKLDRSSNNSIHHYIKDIVPKPADECMSYVANVNIPKPTDEEKLSCEGKLTKNDCWIALSSMGSSKSPGNDGLSEEFYIYFFDEIHSICFRVTKLLIYSWATATLSKPNNDNIS